MENTRLKIIGKKLENDKALFKCDCGAIKLYNFYNVKRGTTKSCGCLRKELMKEKAKERFTGKQPKNFIDYTGRKIGLVKVLNRIDDIRLYTTTYLCECECGTQFKSEISSLRRCKFVNCNCGYKKHKLKRILHGMIERCENPKEFSYKYYGAKGISVYPEWKKYPIKFIQWALDNGWNDNKIFRRKEVLSIDRIDSSKGYCPENCHWITLSENSKKAMDLRWHNEQQ